jgi:hypothetical protein
MQHTVRLHAGNLVAFVFTLLCCQWRSAWKHMQTCFIYYTIAALAAIKAHELMGLMINWAPFQQVVLTFHLDWLTGHPSWLTLNAWMTLHQPSNHRPIRP